MSAVLIAMKIAVERLEAAKKCVVQENIELQAIVRNNLEELVEEKVVRVVINEAVLFGLKQRK